MMCRQPCARGKEILPSTALPARLCFQRTLLTGAVLQFNRHCSRFRGKVMVSKRQSYGL